MIPDSIIAEYSLLAYEQPTIKVSNAGCRIDIIDNHSLVSIAGTNDGRDMITDILAFPWNPIALDEWVHYGFWRYWNKLMPNVFNKLYLNGLPTVWGGHSLGGIASNYGAATWLKKGHAVNKLTTFGAPRGCFKGVLNILKNVSGNRYVREGDQVTWFGLGSHHKESTLLPGNPGIIDHPMQGYLDLIRKN